MGKYFGTDGFRGKAGVDLTAEHAFQVGRFLGWYYSQKHTEDSARIVIGKDTRRSSYMFENALAAGITSSGADAYLLHVTTTPCVSYITRTENFDCGVMISASHNPFYDNGIKLMNGVGEKMDDALQAELEAFIDGDPAYLPWATEGKVGKTIDFYSGRNRYIGYLTSLPSRSFEKHKVGLDCANGSSWMIGRAVFDALGAKTYVINDQPDGVNINTDCGSTHIEGLQLYVREHHLDVGFAFDGDADRCLAVDERGQVLNGDKIMYICAKHFKERGQLPGDTRGHHGYEQLRPLQGAGQGGHPLRKDRRGRPLCLREHEGKRLHDRRRAVRPYHFPEVRPHRRRSHHRPHAHAGDDRHPTAPERAGRRRYHVSSGAEKRPGGR